jgi:hypothetical protein
VVKPARVLEEDVQAELPYEQTSLAKRAPGARRRLVILLGVGALVMLVNAAAGGGLAWIAGGAAAALCIWGVMRGRLGAIVAAALLALLGIMIPLRLFLIAERDVGTIATLVVAVVLGAAALPNVILLFRDAELQNAYGLWARRAELKR